MVNLLAILTKSDSLVTALAYDQHIHRVKDGNLWILNMPFLTKNGSNKTK